MHHHDLIRPRSCCCTTGGYLYTSNDYGLTWSADTSAGNQTWTAITLSADGRSGAATTGPGCIYLYKQLAPTPAPTLAPTVNPGTLIPICSMGITPWSSVASSDLGDKLVASDGYGLLYTSSDGGYTWTGVSSLGNQSWTSVASSSNGSVLVGVTSTGGVYTSVNAGLSWTVQAGAPNVTWSSVASDGEGRAIVATARSGQIWTSQDGGVSWSSTNSPGGGSELWSSVDMSSSGAVQIASVAVGAVGDMSPVMHPGPYWLSA